MCLATAGVTAEAAQHGIDPGDINRDGDRLRRLLRLRQRRLAREQSDSGVHGSLEQALGVRRGQQGACARHPRRGFGEAGLAGRKCRAAVRRFLRRVHGRGAVDAAGVAPVQPLLDEIGAIKAGATCSALIASCTHRRRRAVRASRDAGPARSDADDRQHLRAAARPARPRLLPQDRSRVSSRRARSITCTSRRCSSLPAPSCRRRKAAADDGVRVREALAEASLDNVALRDPKQHGSQDDVRELPKLAPTSTGARTSTPRSFRTPISTSTEPKFLAAVRQGARRRRRSRSGRPTWRWHVLNAAADSLSDAVRRGELRVLRQVPRAARPR